MKKNVGYFSISIDLELAWGVSHKVNNYFINHAINSERKICSNLIKIFESYDIPVSWAIVAALLDRKNENINVSNMKAWYAPDIFEEILNSKIKHHIASHSYSHLNFKTSNVKQVSEDFEKSIYFFKKYNTYVDTLVFPRNQINHLNILKKYNFNFYRSVDQSWYKSVSQVNIFAGKIANLIDKTFPIKTNTISPKKNKFGLLEIPSSMLLISRGGIRYPVTNFSMFQKIKSGIDRAITNNETFHLWFHPSNFYSYTKDQFKLLEKILKYVNLKRSKKLLEVIKLNEFNF